MPKPKDNKKKPEKIVKFNIEKQISLNKVHKAAIEKAIKILSKLVVK